MKERTKQALFLLGMVCFLAIFDKQARRELFTLVNEYLFPPKTPEKT